jgi:polyphosphate kinase
MFIFCNNGNEKIYLSSADWMSRNLMNRIECAFPIYAENNKRILKDIFMIQWNDPNKARKIDGINDTQIINKSANNEAISSQIGTVNYLSDGNII